MHHSLNNQRLIAIQCFNWLIICMRIMCCSLRLIEDLGRILRLVSIGNYWCWIWLFIKFLLNLLVPICICFKIKWRIRFRKKLERFLRLIFSFFISSVKIALRIWRLLLSIYRLLLNFKVYPKLDNQNCLFYSINNHQI